MLRASLIVRTLVLLLCQIVATPAYSWYDTGHRVVAILAEKRLSPEARKQIQDILPAASSLADAAVWPDHEGRSFNDLDPLHYVSVDEKAAGYDADRDCPDSDCMVEALKWFLAVLGDRGAPMRVRRIALRYVTHLVGDMHQPLHAGRARDRGGTLIDVSYRGKTTNLHYFWDSDLVDMEALGPDDLAVRLSGQLTENETANWQSGSPTDWTNESLRLARSHAYVLGNTPELSDYYVESARPIVRRRLLQAGIRLSWLLNGVLR